MYKGLTSVCVCVCAGRAGTVGAAAASGVAGAGAGAGAGTNDAETGDGVVAGGCCFFFSASWNIHHYILSLVTKEST